MFLSRRQFLKVTAGTVAAVAVADNVLALTALQPVIEVGNPLGDYPDRSWERVYHDQYRYDSSFTWVCSPNDTHACRIRAFVRNGVVMRVEQNYDHQTYEDLYGNRGTFAHNPRMCLKGFTFHRRVYGPYRLKGPLMRKGWKEWMDAGSPELTSETKRKYKFDSRFLDDMLRVSWDTAFTYAAKAMIIIATRYSGEAGARRLREQGYAPEMIEMMKGAGTRCFKHRAGMPVLGIIGKMGNTRMNGGVNALLDTWIRKVSPEQAQGGRYWSNYTWHGDQNPAHPWWCGAQGSDIDLSDMRFSKLNTSWGKNFVENKMPEAHWKLECIERGARVVVITPEYNPTAYRADYWMPLRPASDGAIFLGAMKIIVDENMHDIDFLKGFTDSPGAGPDRYVAVPGSARRGGGLQVPGLLQELFGPGAVAEAGAGRAARGDDGVGSEQEAGGAAASGAGGVALSEQRDRCGADGDLPGEAAQWARSRCDAGLADVPGALPGLRSGHLSSDLPHAQGSPGPLGAGFGLDQARRHP